MTIYILHSLPMLIASRGHILYTIKVWISILYDVHTMEKLLNKFLTFIIKPHMNILRTYRKLLVEGNNIHIHVYVYVYMYV